MTRQIVWTECSNFNCQREDGLAEPFSYCISCGSVLEPVDDGFFLIESDNEEHHESD